MRLVGGCAKHSTHTRIIDRLEPTGSRKIVVVRGVSSGCKSKGLLRPWHCQRNLKYISKTQNYYLEDLGALGADGRLPNLLPIHRASWRLR